jgi:methyl-accepting chemotaxis protein
VIVAWSWLNTFRLGFHLNHAYEQMLKLDQLEDAMVSSLLEQKIQQDHFVLSDGEQSYLDVHARAGEQIDETIAWYESFELLLRPDEVNAIEKLAHLQQEYRQTFAGIVTAANAGDGEKSAQLQELSASQMAQMHEQLANLMHAAKSTLADASEQARIQGRRSIMSNVIALMLLPLLAIWAFLVAGRITQPVLTLTNAVVAIEGDQYRPEILAETGDRRDSLGQLARAVDEMAQAIETREQALETEITELREELYQVRRRKRLRGAARRTDESLA